MKKGLLILLFAFVCLLVVGCGKEKDSELITQENDTIKNVESKKKEEKKDKFEPELNTLTCTSKDSKSRLEITEKIEYDVKNFKITKVYSQISAPKTMYTNWFAASLYPDLYDYDGKNTINLTDDEIREFTCVHRGAIEFTECTVEFKGKKAITTQTLDIDDYYKEKFSDTEYEKLDADFLSRIKAKNEDAGYSCTLN